MTIRHGILLAAALGAMLLGALVARINSPPASTPVSTNATVFTVPRPLADFELVDQNGERFDRQRLVGQWSVLFFGFTHCPDVCPTTLQMLASARRRLDGAEFDAAPLFALISVDPERDDSATLARYVSYFDPDFVGVTGPLNGVTGFARAVGVAYQRLPLDDGGYTMDHTAALFFVDPLARLVAVSTPPHSAVAVANDLTALQSGRAAPTAMQP